MDNIIEASTNAVTLIREYLPSNVVLSDMCSFFSVFSDVTRVKLLSALSITELCVTDMAKILDLNQTTVSHQLRLLRDAGMVTYRRNGKIIYYRIANEHFNNVMLTGAVSLGY
ncbi:MAG: metalloregulator ArsR/SmtB family transcription factor [Clostridia bacterium]